MLGNSHATTTPVSTTGPSAEAMPPDQAYKHGTFFDGIRDAAFVPAGIWGVAWRVIVKRKFWRDFFLTSIVFLFLAIVDPVGIASNSTRTSEQLFYRVASPGYPPPSNDPESDTAFDDITEIAVIVIDDETLQRHGEHWPPRFSVHSKVLQKVLEESSPKAVFIDFGFFDDRDTDDLRILTDMLDRRAPPADRHGACGELISSSVECSKSDPAPVQKIPIFLAGAPKGLEVIPRLERAVTGTVSTRYVTEHEERHNSYPLYDCDKARPSAALAMYGAYHDDWKTWSLKRCPEDWRSAGGPNALSVYWATWDRGGYQCRSLPPGRRGRLGKIFEIWLSGLFGRDLWKEQFQTCPPHRSVSAHQFLSDDTGFMSAFIDDRYVFYGGNFAMAGDLVTPPTHEPVPGVFLHAMALDNLLRLQPYVRLATGSGILDRSLWLTLATAVFMSGFIALAWNGYEVLAEPRTGNAEAESPAARRGGNPRGAGRGGEPAPTEAQVIGGFWCVSCLVVSVLVVLSGLWFGFSVFNWAPTNFVGLLSFLGLHTVIAGIRQLLLSIF